MTGKSVKDIDRYQAVLTSLLSLEENKFCADCEAKGKCSILIGTYGQPCHRSSMQPKGVDKTK